MPHVHLAQARERRPGPRASCPLSAASFPVWRAALMALLAAALAPPFWRAAAISLIDDVLAPLWRKAAGR